MPRLHRPPRPGQASGACKGEGSPGEQARRGHGVSAFNTRRGCDPPGETPPTRRALWVGTARCVQARTPPNREDKHSKLRPATPVSGCEPPLSQRLRVLAADALISQFIKKLSSRLERLEAPRPGSCVFSTAPRHRACGGGAGLAGPPSWRQEPLQAQRSFVPLHAGPRVSEQSCLSSGIAPHSHRPSDEA